MAIAFQPERIDPKNFGRGYDVRSDVWSLGITLVSTWESLLLLYFDITNASMMCVLLAFQIISYLLKIYCSACLTFLIK